MEPLKCNPGEHYLSGSSQKKKKKNRCDAVNILKSHLCLGETVPEHRKLLTCWRQRHDLSAGALALPEKVANHEWSARRRSAQRTLQPLWWCKNVTTGLKEACKCFCIVAVST